MSENMEKLREAIAGYDRARAQYDEDLRLWEAFKTAIAARDAALAAVEQELAALEAERDELRKRPTNKEVTRAIWEDAPLGLDGNGVRIEIARNVDKLFDAKAAQ